MRRHIISSASSRYQQNRSSLACKPSESSYGEPYLNDAYIELNTVEKRIEGFRVRSVSDAKK